MQMSRRQSKDKSHVVSQNIFIYSLGTQQAILFTNQ